MASITIRREEPSLFENCRTRTDRGNVGEAAAIYYYSCQGKRVSIPLARNQEYDLIIEAGGIMERVSVKTTTRRARYGGWEVTLRTLGGNQSFNAVKKFDASKVDRLFVLAGDGAMYDIPASSITVTSTIVVGNDGAYDKHRCSRDASAS